MLIYDQPIPTKVLSAQKCIAICISQELINQSQIKGLPFSPYNFFKETYIHVLYVQEYVSLCYFLVCGQYTQAHKSIQN